MNVRHATCRRVHAFEGLGALALPPVGSTPAEPARRLQQAPITPDRRTKDDNRMRTMRLKPAAALWRDVTLTQT